MSYERVCINTFPSNTPTREWQSPKFQHQLSRKQNPMVSRSWPGFLLTRPSGHPRALSHLTWSSPILALPLFKVGWPHSLDNARVAP